MYIDALAETGRDGMAIAQIVDAVNVSPIVEEVSFLVSAGPGEPVGSTYPRTQYLMDYVIPEVRKRLQSSASEPGEVVAVER
ncbi:hypothetical protein [Williamsia soli]|uniref:hypothetical protein n=1 Tax=Williamsia soli TaxID=364929 RepID=UPI001A9D36B7|nr:hypothetical protein [Williamsia soli]